MIDIVVGHQYECASVPAAIDDPMPRARCKFFRYVAKSVWPIRWYDALATYAYPEHR
jgi:hypothetical protein